MGVGAWSQSSKSLRVGEKCSSQGDGAENGKKKQFRKSRQTEQKTW
jgi:hypothetical protein